MPNLYLQQADGTPVATFKLHNDFAIRASQEEVTVLAIIPEAASASPTPAGPYTRTDESPDLIDGGGASALVEKEAGEGWQGAGKVGNAAYWRARSEGAEDTLSFVQQQRDQATDRAEKAEALCATETAVANHRGATILRVAEERNDARTMAALWKETARRLVTQRNGARRYGTYILAARDRAVDQVVREQHRAEKAERERDEAHVARDDAEAYIDDLRDQLAAQEPAVIEKTRTLGPDDITDEMVERARVAYDSGQDHVGILDAALTEPPTRPEGAQEIEARIQSWLAATPGGSISKGHRASLADHLAHGTRMTGAES